MSERSANDGRTMGERSARGLRGSIAKDGAKVVHTKTALSGKYRKMPNRSEDFLILLKKSLLDAEKVANELGLTRIEIARDVDVHATSVQQLRDTGAMEVIIERAGCSATLDGQLGTGNVSSHKAKNQMVNDGRSDGRDAAGWPRSRQRSRDWIARPRRCVRHARAQHAGAGVHRNGSPPETAVGAAQR